MQRKAWRQKIDIRIDRARIEDIDAVYRIEKEQFPNPWKKHHLIAELDHDISFFYVARNIIPGDVVGYIIFWIIEETIELHDIAVAPGAQGKGLGKKLMDFMIARARGKEVKEIFLEVRRSNAPAIGLYERYGFEQIGVREGYFNEPREDALVYGLYL